MKIESNVTQLVLCTVIAVAALVTLPDAAAAQRGRAHVVVVVPFGPPAPPVFVVPPSPHPGAVWGDGYYDWDGHQHAWRDGRWHPGRPGFHHMSRTWSHSDRGWSRGGGWVRD